MRPSVTTYVSEGPIITLPYIRNGFLIFIIIIDFSMAMAREICTRTYNSEFFDSINGDSSDVEFQQIIYYIRVSVDTFDMG